MIGNVIVGMISAKTLISGLLLPTTHLMMLFAYVWEIGSILKRGNF